MRHDFWRQLKFFGANLGFHRRESNSRQNECGKSMKLDFEARSATFEEKWIAMTHDFQPSRKKMNQMFKQCLEHLCFRACFCAKRAKLGWMHSFCTSFQMAILLKNKEGGSMTDIRKNHSIPTIESFVCLFSKHVVFPVPPSSRKTRSTAYVRHVASGSRRSTPKLVPTT